MDMYLTSHAPLIQRLCGKDSVPFDDLFWLELLRFERSFLTRDPTATLAFLEPNLQQLAIHNGHSGNFAQLAAHCAEYISRSTQPEAGTADLQHACNACALLSCATAYLLSVTPPQNVGSLFTPPQGSSAGTDVLGRLMHACLHTLGSTPSDGLLYALHVAVQSLCVTLCSSQLYYANADTPGASASRAPHRIHDLLCTACVSCVVAAQHAQARAAHLAHRRTRKSMGAHEYIARHETSLFMTTSRDLELAGTSAPLDTLRANHAHAPALLSRLLRHITGRPPVPRAAAAALPPSSARAASAGSAPSMTQTLAELMIAPLAATLPAWLGGANAAGWPSALADMSERWLLLLLHQSSDAEEAWGFRWTFEVRHLHASQSQVALSQVLVRGSVPLALQHDFYQL